MAHTVVGIGPRQQRDLWTGTKAIAPLLPSAVLFGLAFGALVRDVGVEPWVGPLGSATVVAGTAQIAILEQLRLDAPLGIVVLTALVINARFALYSAALAPLFAAYPRRWRYGLVFMATDQASITMLTTAEEYPDPVRRRWVSLGAAGSFFAAWIVATVAGVALGPTIPPEWQIGFTVPLVFLALIVPTLRSYPSVVAAVVAAIAVVLLRELPFGLNVLLAALAGIAVGALVPNRRGEGSGGAGSAHKEAGS